MPMRNEGLYKTWNLRISLDNIYLSLPFIRVMELKLETMNALDIMSG